MERITLQADADNVKSLGLCKRGFYKITSVVPSILLLLFTFWWKRSARKRSAWKCIAIISETSMKSITLQADDACHVALNAMQLQRHKVTTSMTSFPYSTSVREAPPCIAFLPLPWLDRKVACGKGLAHRIIPSLLFVRFVLWNDRKMQTCCGADCKIGCRGKEGCAFVPTWILQSHPPPSTTKFVRWASFDIVPRDLSLARGFGSVFWSNTWISHIL